MRRDVADNIDLYMILSEFEQFYEMKFMKPPKIIKKVDNPEGIKGYKLSLQIRDYQNQHRAIARM